MRQRGATSWGGVPGGEGRALEMLLCPGFAIGGIRQLQHAQLLPQLENVARNV